jgi:hypothetical protein
LGTIALAGGHTVTLNKIQAIFLLSTLKFHESLQVLEKTQFEQLKHM